MTYGRLAQRERSCLTSKRSQVQILYLPPLITCHAFAWHFLFWAFSSAGEHFLHTEGVIGSIPVTPTICFKVRLRRTFFRYKRHVAAWHSDGTAASPSPLDVRSTPGGAFTASALVRIPLAVSTNYGSPLTPFGCSFPEGASFEASPSGLISLCFK